MIEICRKRDWQSPSGQLKDISARDMLRSLDKADKIALPPPKTSSYRIGEKLKIKHMEHNMEPVEWSLAELLPVRLELINVGVALAEFKSYIDQFHYLESDRTMGENMKCMVKLITKFKCAKIFI